MISGILKALSDAQKKSTPKNQESNELKVGFGAALEEHTMYVASHGGGGHIAAIRALRERDKKAGHNIENPHLLPQMADWRAKKLRELGSILANTAKIGTILKKYDVVPDMPPKDELWAEAKKLMDTVPDLDFICALVHPHDIVGALDAKLWDILQAAEKTEQLQLLLARQEQSDIDKYAAAYKFFYEELCESRKTGKPYTRVACTQAMTLNAICDAVIQYNKDNSRIPGFIPIIIEQYLTDFATSDAVHFSGSLGRLKAEQRKVMRLHAMGPINQMIRNNTIDVDRKGQFASVEEIKPENNPMVRSGFSEPQFEIGSDFIKLEVQQSKSSTEKITIPNNATVSTIMLGSQAGIASIDYAVNLLQSSAADECKTQNREFHLFLLAGTKREEYLTKIIKKVGSIPPHIKLHVLPNQNDKQLGAIDARANIKVQRAGGLSVMEAITSAYFASKHSVFKNQRKVIFVHHSGLKDDKPTSGISWEDANRDEMKKELRKINIPVISTTVTHFSKDLSQALGPVFNSASVSQATPASTSVLPSVNKQKVPPVKTYSNPGWLLQSSSTSVVYENPVQEVTNLQTATSSTPMIKLTPSNNGSDP